MTFAAFVDNTNIDLVSLLNTNPNDISKFANNLVLGPGMKGCLHYQGGNGLANKFLVNDSTDSTAVPCYAVIMVINMDPINNITLPVFNFSADF